MLRSQLLRRLPARHLPVVARSAASYSSIRLVDAVQGTEGRPGNVRSLQTWSSEPFATRGIRIDARDSVLLGRRTYATVVVPSMGESMTEGTIATVLKNSGDSVKTDDIIAQIETDKVTIDIRAPHDGVIQSLNIKAGDVVKPGQPVAELGASTAAAAPKPASAASASPAAASGPPVNIVVPSMGDSISEGTVAALLKAPGSAVNTDDIVAQIETDKVTIDVRAPGPGTVTEIKVAQGDVVKVGQTVAVFSAGAATAASAAKPVAVPAAAAASPKAAPAAVAPPPKPAAAPAAPSGARTERRIPMTKLRMRVAERLKSAQNTYALLTTFNEVDMSGIMQLRNDYKDAFVEKHGVKLGFMSAFVKAAVSALQEVPAVNGVIDGTDIVYREFYDISVAVGTAKGLVVPVLRNADRLSFAGIEKGIAALGKKARDGTLSVDDMAGGTFTISNGGVYGSLLSTPIVNPPQSAILGMHAIVERPVVVKGAIVVRPIMNVALTYDHRIIDGREAVTFLKRIKDVVEHPERMLLDL